VSFTARSDSDDFAFGRWQYADGTSSNGMVTGTVRFGNGAPVPYADVLAVAASGAATYGAVADAAGLYAIREPAAGSYFVFARPLTTDPTIVSSVPYRANDIANLDFMPAYYGGGLQVHVQDGAVTSGIDITVIRSGSEADGNEPNDGVATASPLVPGFSKLGGMHAPSDDDWFWFQTAPNTCFVATTVRHGASVVPTASRRTVLVANASCALRRRRPRRVERVQGRASTQPGKLGHLL
jgi:hypothetical protein